MTRHKDIHWRVTEEYKKKLKLAAIMDGRTVSSFLESACNEKIQRIKEWNKEVS